MSDERDETEEEAEGEEPGESEQSLPPDRLSNDPTSRFYDEALVGRGIGIRFRGKVRTNVNEYCVSEGWVKMTVGKSVDRFGRPLVVKTTGDVEAWFEDLGDDAPVRTATAMS